MPSIAVSPTPNSWSSSTIFSRGSFSILSTTTHTGAKFSSETSKRESTACSTLRDETLMPTSSLVIPIFVKKVVIAASSSASASTPSTPTMSMFHW